LIDRQRNEHVFKVKWGCLPCADVGKKQSEKKQPKIHRHCMSIDVVHDVST